MRANSVGRTLILALAVAILSVTASSAAAGKFDANNAKKVDGIRATKFTTKASKRKNKLVATNKAGMLPDNIVGKVQDAAHATTADKALDLNCKACVTATELKTNAAKDGQFLSFNAGALTWQNLNSWLLTGNAGTNPANQFLGTTDNQPLVFRTNKVEAMRIDTAGNVGVGTTGPIAKLEASSTTGIGLLGTSASRGVVGRIGSATSCPGTYGVGGCGSTGGIGVLGDSASRGVVGTLGNTSCAGVYAVGGCGSSSGIGVFGNSDSRGMVGALGGAPCEGVYAVGGCAGSANADGVYGVSGSGGGAGVRAVASNSSTNIFVGESPIASVRARIDATGKGFFNGGTQTGGADYAESVRARRSDGLEPGDVLAIDPSHGNAVRKSWQANSRYVAGIYSTKPSILAVGGKEIGDSLAGRVPMALVGLVPTKVTAAGGPIRTGDLLTTSNVPGRAMKAKSVDVRGIHIYSTGTILGKALEPLASGEGTIKVLVTLK